MPNAGKVPTASGAPLRPLGACVWPPRSVWRLAGVIWGVNFVLVKFAVGQMPPLYYLGLRFLVGAVVLAPFSVGRLRRLNRQGWLIGCGVGVLLFGGFVLQTIGLQIHLARRCPVSSPVST